MVNRYAIMASNSPRTLLVTMAAASHIQRLMDLCLTTVTMFQMLTTSSA
jgi:hypothetical protein